MSLWSQSARRSAAIGMAVFVALAVRASAQEPNTPPPQPGNSTLVVVSGLPSPVGVPNPLASHSFVLLRQSYADVIQNSGIAVPAGVSPYKYASTACAHKSPDCTKLQSAVRANAVSSVRAGVDGNGTFPPVPPGTYYLMVSGHYDKKAIIWVQSVQLRPGTKTIRLDQNNAIPIE